METIARLAWRSIWRNKRRTIINLVSIAIGLGLTIFFFSMAHGAFHQLIEDVVRMQAGHLTIEHKDYRTAPAVDLYIENISEIKSKVEALPNVNMTKALITGNAVAKSGDGAIGVGFLGVQPSKEIELSPVADKMIEGRFLEDTDERGALIGSNLARRLKIGIGSRMVLSTNDVYGNFVEELTRVTGIFETGSTESDTYLVFVPIDFAADLVGMPHDAATQFGIILENPNGMVRLQSIIESTLTDNNAAVLTWREVMPDIAAYVEFRSSGQYIFYAIIIILVLFTVFNTILMSILERKREFAIMLAIGTSPRMLKSQVVFESVLLGFFGVVLGALAGSIVSYHFQIHGLDFSSVLGEEETFEVSIAALDTVVYSRLTPLFVWGMSLIVFCSTILLSLLTMRRATDINLSEIVK